MRNTYDTYLTAVKAIPIDQMHRLHQGMLAEVGQDQDAQELYDELTAACAEYTAIRGKWGRMSLEEKMASDPLRTALHNTVIVRLDVLARWLRRQGKSASWRENLGYEADDPYNRKAIGDFACYLTFIEAINAR